MSNKSIISVIFGLYPFLNIYSLGVPLLSIGQFLLFTIFMIYVLRDGLPSRYIYFKPFFIYAFFVSVVGCLISWVNPLDVIHDNLSLTLFCIMLFPAVRFVDYKYFVKTVRLFGLVCLAFFFIQYLFLQIGVTISGIIPFLPLKDGETADLIVKQMDSTRNSSLFMEPSHYSQYMVIVLIMFLLMDKKNIKNILISIIITISLLLSGSSTGYALFTLVWAVWSFEFVKNVKYKSLAIVFVAVFLGAATMYIMSNDSFADTFGRYKELNIEIAGTTSHGYSSYIRMVRGYSPFLESDFLGKLFGHGLGSHIGYLDSHHNSDFYILTDLIPHWMNSFQYLLFSVGIIGTGLFWLQIIRMFKKTSKVGKTALIALVLLFLSADCLFNSFLIIYIAIMEMNLHSNIRLDPSKMNNKKLNNYGFNNNTLLQCREIP